MSSSVHQYDGCFAPARSASPAENLPKFLGVLLAIAGLGFVARSLTFVLLPSYASDLLLLPVFVAIVALTGWLLVKGVDVRNWEEKVATSEVQ